MAAVSKAEYLKRYLSGTDDAKRKKKPKKDKKVKESRMRIIDTELDCLPAPPVKDRAKRNPLLLAAGASSGSEDEAPVVELLDKTSAEELAMAGRFKSDGFRSVPLKPAKAQARKRHDSSGSSDGGGDPGPAPSKRNDSDSDVEVRRPGAVKEEEDSDLDLLRPGRGGSEEDDDSDLEVRRPPRPGAPATQTLSGQTAGLQSAAALRAEADKLRRRQDRAFARADKAALGKDADTVFRNRREGTRRDLGTEAEAAEAKAKRDAELKAKYAVWNRGVAQKKDREDRIQEAAKVAEQPMARYSGDADLEDHLKQQDLREDPMAEYFAKKKARTSKVAHLPKYSGRPGPPNRFGIRPGYRWDGVDRGNGFENKIYQRNNDRTAEKTEYYKWQSGAYE